MVAYNPGVLIIIIILLLFLLLSLSLLYIYIIIIIIIIIIITIKSIDFGYAHTARDKFSKVENSNVSRCFVHTEAP